jgi:hypothetical protein
MVTPELELESPVGEPTPTPVTDTTVIQEALFVELDTLAASLSQNSLQYAWKADELWRVSYEEFMEQSGGKEKKALGAFIGVVQEREAKDILQRSTVAERLRVGKFCTRTQYAKIVEVSGGFEPSFNQIRRCIITNNNGEFEKGMTDEMVGWCIDNQWPTVADIDIHRSVVNPGTKKAVDPKERHYAQFVKLAQIIMEEATAGSPRYDAAKAVFETWKKETA